LLAVSKDITQLVRASLSSIPASEPAAIGSLDSGPDAVAGWG